MRVPPRPCETPQSFSGAALHTHETITWSTRDVSDHPTLQLRADSGRPCGLLASAPAEQERSVRAGKIEPHTHLSPFFTLLLVAHVAASVVTFPPVLTPESSSSTCP